MKIKPNGFLVAFVGALLCLLVVTSFAAASFVVAQDRQERRTIPVSVVDKDGNFVEGLTAENFRGKFRGQPVLVLSAERNLQSHRIAILVDATASMKGNDYAATVWVAAEEAIATLTVRYQIFLYVVSSEVQRRAIPTGSRERVHTALLKLVTEYREKRPTGRSALVDALSVIVDDLHPAQLGDAIYFITDGFDNQSSVRERALREKLSRTGVRVFVACIPIGILKKPTRESYGSICQAFSEASGGRAVRLMLDDPRPPSIKRMVAQAGELYPTLADVYRVEIELPQEVDKPRKWKLEMVDERGKKIKGLKVFYPRLLVPLEETPEK